MISDDLGYADRSYAWREPNTGIARGGFMTGGKAVRWVDENIRL